MKILALIMLLLAMYIVAACTTLSPIRHPTVRQIIVPIMGHTGLVNMACDTPECVGGPTAREYDIKDPVVRKMFIDLGFACVVGKKIFGFSPDRPGIIRTYGGGWFSHPKEEYLDIVKDYNFLISADTKCFQRDTYPLFE